MAESWARRISLCLACKPFPGLCEPFSLQTLSDLAGDARQWWQLGLCLCSLTEQTGAVPDQQFRFLMRYPRQKDA